MGRLHFSSAPKYQKVEPACEVQTIPTWADQAFDPEAEILNGQMMVYEAFLDRGGRPPLADDADAISELTSESSSSAATEDEEYTSERPAPPSPRLNEFDDFVRVEVPRTEPDGRPLTMPRPSSPLRQSITSANLDDPHSHIYQVAVQHSDEDRLFGYYQARTTYERERLPYASRPPPGLDPRTASPARRFPGHPRFLSRVEGQRAPLANPPVSDHPHVRPRSASVSDVLTRGARVPDRWWATHPSGSYKLTIYSGSPLLKGHPCLAEF
ncbi:hypothetical protein CTheo_2103 [Ceratobasidium theobromae]|uniref:Uncharacterized protein n=1 Tax=Ceratobasidium theobromae TaxID=1582974 RepID=A0A5N5QRS9_9AGAM|nr:hypothetical protein CTheo_2103 [Ceratobasidium theobromae]